METEFRFTEEAFLSSTFAEFKKCWRSGKNSRLIIKTVNGHAFVNFTAYLGYPNERHDNPRWRQNQQPRKTSTPRKKSPRKTQRDNERAASFQRSKRDSAAASATAPGPEDSSKSSPSAASSPSPAPTAQHTRLEVTSSTAPTPAPVMPGNNPPVDFSFSEPTRQENVARTVILVIRETRVTRATR